MKLSLGMTQANRNVNQSWTTIWFRNPNPPPNFPTFPAAFQQESLSDVTDQEGHPMVLKSCT